MVVSSCWSFQTAFFPPSRILTPPSGGPGYKLCSFFLPGPNLCSLYFPRLLHSPECLAYVFHLPRVGSMGMQWAQKLISDWCLRVLIWTSWCSHASNVNKAHAFGWAYGVLCELFNGDQPAAQAQAWPLKTASEILEDLGATRKPLWKIPSLPELATDSTGNIGELLATARVWKLWNSLWTFQEGTVGKFGGGGQVFRWLTGTHFWHLPPQAPI